MGRLAFAEGLAWVLFAMIAFQGLCTDLAPCRLLCLTCLCRITFTIPITEERPLRCLTASEAGMIESREWRSFVTVEVNDCAL